MELVSGYNYPSIDRVDDSKVTLSEEERDFVRTNTAEIAQKYLRDKGFRFRFEHSGVDEREMGTALMALNREHLTSADGQDVSAWLEVGRGYSDADAYIGASTIVDEIEKRYDVDSIIGELNDEMFAQLAADGKENNL